MGAAGAGMVLGGAMLGGGLAGTLDADPAAAATSEQVPFYGAHQAGIATPAQDRLAFATLNVVEGTDRQTLRDLLADWSDAGGQDDQGPAGRRGHRSRRGAARHRRGGRLGRRSAHRHHRVRPVVLRRPVRPGGQEAGGPGTTLPPLPNENLDPAYTGGDLCLQACSDDPLVAFHAVRNLARLGMGVVEHNWMELGFGRTSTTSTAEATPRNLLGFKDGTRNIKAQQTDLMDDYVWVGPEADQPWFRGGSYLVARRIRMFIENWDRDVLERPAERHRTGQDHRGAAHRWDGVHHPELHGAQTIRASRSSRPTPTSAWPATRRTAGPASCVAATPTPTASTR